MDVTDRQAVATALARTYGGDRDGWERVEEYQRVLEFTGEHPNKGSAAVASAVELPRGRIRPWIDDDARPDPVRGVQIAEEHGWLDLEWTEPPFTGLNVLVAWIFSGGSIEAEWFVPLFALDDSGADERLERAFQAIGLEYELLREDATNRATEARPTEAASVLGRLLHALGAPVGAKNRDTALTLPDYLEDSPYPVRLPFGRTYVQNRQTARPDRPNTPVQIAEERSPAYRRQLVAFLRGVVGIDLVIRGKSSNIRLDQRAAAMLCPEAFGPE